MDLKSMTDHAARTLMWTELIRGLVPASTNCLFEEGTLSPRFCGGSIACELCEATCPAQAITVEAELRANGSHRTTAHSNMSSYICMCIHHQHVHEGTFNSDSCCVVLFILQPEGPSPLYPVSFVLNVDLMYCTLQMNLQYSTSRTFYCGLGKQFSVFQYLSTLYQCWVSFLVSVCLYSQAN